MTLKEKLSENYYGGNGIFTAGFDAAVKLILEEVPLDRTQQELVYNIGEQEIAENPSNTENTTENSPYDPSHEFNGS